MSQTVGRYRPAAPRELRVIAEKALSMDPADRYASTQDMAADITSYLSGEKVASVSYTPRELLLRFLRRHRMAVAAGFLAFVSLVAALVFMSWAYRRESVARNAATEARREESREREKAQHAREMALTQRQRAETALGKSQAEQRRAHFNLAQATLESARMMLRLKRYHEAFLLGAASRLHNPVHPRSPWHIAGYGDDHPEAVQLLASADALVLLAQSSSSLFLRDIHLPAGPMAMHGMVTTRLHWVDSSPDSQWFTHADGTDGITVREVASGKLVVRLDGGGGVVELAAFGKQGSSLLTLDRGGQAIWWELPTGKRLGTLQLPVKKPGAFLMALPAPGNFLWTGVSGGMWLLDAAAGKFSLVREDDKDEFFSVCLHPSGSHALSTYRNGDIKSTRIPDGQTRTLHSIGHRAGFRCYFSEDGRFHLTEYVESVHSEWAFDLRTLKLTQLSRQTGLPQLPLYHSRSHLPGYDWFGVSPEELGLWSPATGGFRELARGQGRQLEFLRQVDPQNLFAADAQGRVLHWQTREPARREYASHKKRIQLVKQSPDQKWFVSAAWDGVVHLHEEGVSRGVPLGPAFGNAVWSMDWSPDGRMIAAIDSSGALRVYEAQGRKLMFEHNCADGMFPTVVFSPDSSVLRVLSRHFAYTFALPSGELIRQVKGGLSNTNGGPTDPCRRRAVFNDGKEVIALDYETGERRSLDLPDLAIGDIVACAAMEGDVFLCQARDYRIHVFRWPSLERISVLDGNKRYYSSARLHPDGQWILTSADDGTCRVWDLETGRPLLVFTAGVDEKSGVDAQFFQVSHDGKRLIMSGGRQVFSIPLDWTLSLMEPQALLELAEQKTGLWVDGIFVKPRAARLPDKQ